MKHLRRIIVALAAIAVIVAMTGCAATPQPGQIGVVRYGKSIVPWTWINSNKIRKVVCPGSGFTWTGFGSKVHWYPDESVQRNYTITSESGQGDRKGADQVEVPTSDGVRAGLEGTFYFTTAFNCSKEGQALLKDFEERFGVRTFRENAEGESLHPYEGESGWRAFLSQAIRPVINNDLRRSIATVTCAELVSSCSLIHNNGGGSTTVTANGSQNNSSLQKVQEDINATLKSDIQSTLGNDYFSHISFLLEHVTLPSSIQEQIDNAQAQYAAVGSAAAKVKQAGLEAQANEERERGYEHCNACAQIDELKSIPSSVTTFAPGAGFAVTAK